jgi:hypothetical protein
MTRPSKSPGEPLPKTDEVSGDRYLLAGITRRCPLLCARQLDAFTDLLRGFGPAQWARPTICPGLDAKDVAAPRLLIEQLSITGNQVAGFLADR